MMTVTEFDRMLRSKKGECVIYRSKDQDDYDPFSNAPTATMRFTGHDVVLSNPNLTLIFKNRDDTLRFDMVRDIRVSDSASSAGREIDITCTGGIAGGVVHHRLFMPQ